MAKERNLETFCNATECELFMWRNCEKCDRYVWYGDVTPDNPACPIEEAILDGMWDESKFPSKFIKQKVADDGTPYIPHCTEKNKPVVEKQLPGQLNLLDNLDI